MSHKSDGGLPLLSARPAVTPATLKRAANQTHKHAHRNDDEVVACVYA